MAHLHEIRDNDSHFIIDPETRNMTNRTGKMVTVMQYDHNSERVTFEIPKMIEGHDMSLSNIVQVFYENTSRGTSANKRITAAGAKELDKPVAAEDDPDILVFSWLISQETTQLDGTISFQIRFVCYGDAESDIQEYSWRTNLCTAFNVLSSLNTINDVVEANPDIFIELNRKMDQLEVAGVSDDRLRAAVGDYLDANPIPDGESAYEIAVRNGFNGTEEEWLKTLRNSYNTTTIKLDFTNWLNGSFTETLHDGTVYDYQVTFDEAGMPSSFLLPDGRSLAVIIPPFEKLITYYLYNGVKLPELPEWDKIAYPYAMITIGEIDNSNTGAVKYYLSVSKSPVYQNSDGAYVIPYPSSFTYCKMLDEETITNKDEGGWAGFVFREAEISAQYDIVWANLGHDIGDIIGNEPVKFEGG